MQKIVINGRFLTQNITGVQRFAIEISKRLKVRNEVVIVCPRNIILTAEAQLLEARVVGSHVGHLWEQVDLPLWLYKNGSPLLLNFCNMAPIFYKNKISTLHDITYRRFPYTYSWKFRIVYNIVIPFILKSSKHIFTVSKFSLNEISSLYKIKKSKFSIVYNAVDRHFTHVENEGLRAKNYILAVSSIKENKNFIVALEAFLRVKEKFHDLNIFIIGDMKNGSFGKINISKYMSSSSIKFLGRVSDEDLIKYYSNAIAFVFPSLYEGFGIPVLEAQSCGCPVISSNSSSLPEVLGDSAVMCAKESIESFAKGIKKVYLSSVIRDRLITKGYINVSRFSWDASVKEIEKYLLSLKLE